MLFLALVAPALLSPGLATRAAAQEAPERPTARAVARTGEIRIDGRLDEPAWERAPAASGFVQGEPVEGAPPARPTEVRVLFDSDALWVGARMFDDPGAIADQLVRRDEEGQYDYFEVLLDPDLDTRTGYLFRISASGVERDAYLFDDTEEDDDWDAVWESGVHRDPAGWSAELRIPLSRLRYGARAAEQTWGVNFVRRRLASASTSYFSLQSRTVDGRVSQFGRIEGLVLPEPGGQLQLEPYVATRLATGPSVEGDPFFDGSELEPRLGLDARYGLGSALRVDLTLNPDFGQVEVDPAVVNLTAFETFFPEKRPFFVQDARVFDFDLSSRRSRLFFSRRIGREPHVGAPGDADFADVPEQTTILAAGKFTGRTRGGLSVGVLAAATEAETGRAFFREGAETRAVAVEPGTGYGVARLRQDLREGATRLGAILTAVRRSLPEEGPLTTLPSTALTGGLDFQHQWGGTRRRRWSLSGYVAGSHVRGSPEAMVAIQTNPQHYHQRPDADRLSVDSAATRLTGMNWNVRLAKQGGEHWTWSAALEQLSPDFSVNDLGFLDQGEQFDFTGIATYRVIEPGALFRAWSLRLLTFHELRHELLDDPFSTAGWARAYKDGNFSLNGDFDLHNNWFLDLGVDYGPRSLSDTRTRGGPLMTEPASLGFELRLSTDPRRAVSLGPSLEYTDRLSGAGHELELGLDVTVRPAPSFELRLEPELSLEDDAAQYVAATDAVPFPATFGRRYLFADLERTELSMETRLDLTLTPDLSLQLFAQPLVSAGDFVAYKQLARPASFEFDAFVEGTAVVADGADGEVRCRDGATCAVGGTRWFDLDGDGATDFSVETRDFTIRSLRGNAVLRWEYRPGSVLFLVWQQSRESDAGVGRFDFGRDVGALFDAPAHDTFILKVSHFLDL